MLRSLNKSKNSRRRQMPSAGIKTKIKSKPSALTRCRGFCVLSDSGSISLRPPRGLRGATRLRIGEGGIVDRYQDGRLSTLPVFPRTLSAYLKTMLSVYSFVRSVIFAVRRIPADDIDSAHLVFGCLSFGNFLRRANGVIFFARLPSGSHRIYFECAANGVVFFALQSRPSVSADGLSVENRTVATG